MRQGEGEGVGVAEGCHWNIFELEYRENKTHTQKNQFLSEIWDFI